MRLIGVEERRARLGVQHRLAPSARPDDDVAAIARAVVALHASDPATVVLSALARMARPDVSAVEQALYDERSVVRMLGMRRTLFTVARDVAPVVQASSAAAVAAVERRKLLALLAEHGVARAPERWLAKVERATLAAVAELGEAAATDLTPRVPELAIQLTVAPGKSYEAKVGVSSRVLFLLAAEGHVVRGRPKGRWTSSQHRWSTTERWFGAPLADLDPAAARVDLAQRWLERYGPGTVADLTWWTGWTLGAARAALAELDTAEVALEDGVGLVLAGDLEPPDPPEPWVALLPSLDPSTMGWKGRTWYLGDHKAQVFDGNGNAGATIWADGRIVGGWAHRADGTIRTRLLEDLGTERAEAVATGAARLEAVLEGTVVTPRFPAPLDRELRA